MAASKKQFHEIVRMAMDGRTNNWLHEKTGISKSDISLILSGKLIPSDNHKQRIISALPVLQKI